MQRDTCLDSLLDLHGQVIVIDSEATHWVRFIVRLVPISVEKPHGLDYSLTLHGPAGERLVGFDNAHAIKAAAGPGGKRPFAHDHRHRLRMIRPYEYKDAATLLSDFWAEVDAVLRERGINP